MTLTGESGTAIPSIALNDENTMPVLGLGVAELSDDETERAVRRLKFSFVPFVCDYA